MAVVVDEGEEDVDAGEVVEDVVLEGPDDDVVEAVLDVLDLLEVVVVSEADVAEEAVVADVPVETVVAVVVVAEVVVVAVVEDVMVLG